MMWVKSRFFGMPQSGVPIFIFIRETALHFCYRDTIMPTLRSCAVSLPTWRSPVSIVVLLFPFCACAEDMLCPNEVPAAALGRPDIAGGWVGFIPHAFALSGAGFMQGAPETLAALKPDSTVETRIKLLHTWKFSGPYPNGKWLSCNYGDGALSLSKRISDNTTACTVTYGKFGQTRYKVLKISCN